MLLKSLSFTNSIRLFKTYKEKKNIRKEQAAVIKRVKAQKYIHFSCYAGEQENIMYETWKDGKAARKRQGE